MTYQYTPLDIISSHIVNVIDYLVHHKPDSSLETDPTNTLAAANLSQQSATDDSPQSLTLLLISEDKSTQIIQKSVQKHLLQNKNLAVSISITSISIAQFISMPYEQRYSLGCFIHPQCDLNLSNNTDDSDEQRQKFASKEVSLDSAELKTISIKLRDLFAQQSLMFLPMHLSEHSLHNFGYSMVTPDASQNKEDCKQPQIVCWQFNLYDYKQRPDWLNAKYWANPENFNKYRW